MPVSLESVQPEVAETIETADMAVESAETAVATAVADFFEKVPRFLSIYFESICYYN